MLAPLSQVDPILTTRRSNTRYGRALSGGSDVTIVVLFTLTGRSDVSAALTGGSDINNAPL